MINIIVAVAKNNVIGCANRLIWHLSADLKRFKGLTTGHPVIMGRKTYDSIGSPLPNRKNVVITRRKGLRVNGVTVVNSLEAAIALFDPSEQIFIIGGGEIYRQALPIADRLYVTLVDQSPKGDTVFPEIDPKIWREVSRDEREGFAFIDYERATKK